MGVFHAGRPHKAQDILDGVVLSAAQAAAIAAPAPFTFPTEQAATHIALWRKHPASTSQ